VAQPIRTTDLGHTAVDEAVLPTTDLRSASGEITVRQSPVRLESAASEERLARLREESARRFVRPSQTATPPGSARALDEPPPLAGIVAAPARRMTPVRLAPAPKVIVDQPRVSAAGADDEPVARSRRRGLVLVSTAALILMVGAWLGLRSRIGSDDEAVEVAGVAAAPAPAAAPIVPMGNAPSAADVTPTPVAGRRPVGGTAVVHDELDERNADPKLARNRGVEAGTLLAACHMAFSEARMKDAEAACTAARDANPESAEAYGLLAHALFNRNRRREALAAADRAVKLNPKWADAYVIIGGVHQDAGHTEEARRAYQRYLDLDPKGQYAADLRAIVGKLEPGKL
jgi:hypothetical protein